MKRLLIAAEVSTRLRHLLEADSRFDVRYELLRTEEELVRAVAEVEILVTRHYNPLTAAVIAAAPSLEVIAQGTTGLDNIDQKAARSRGISILDAAGENANAVAELVLSHMISLSRTVPLYHRMMMGNEWVREDCDTRHELRWYRLGIVGLGHVGRRVAALAAAFGLRAFAYDPYLDAAEIERRNATKVESLETLLRESSMVTLHVPLTEETRGMVGQRELDLLPRGAIVINACRGEVIDRQLLLAKLERGELGGVALDVYDPEPPAALTIVDDSRLILTPHIAGCSHESKASIGTVIYRKLCDYYGWSVSSE